MKKGLIFYIGLLLLLVFGFALVCMVIMLFSPGKNVIGFQYFKNSQQIVLQETTDASKKALDLTTEGKYDEIEIKTGYSKVRVEHGNAFKKSGVVLINKTKGFVKTSNATKFSYSVTVEETDNGGVKYNKLKIEVKEPSSFLFFSKQAEVVVHLADNGSNPFANTKFNITTTSGSIAFGGNTENAYTQDMSIGAVQIKTKSGNVSFNEKINYNKENSQQTFSDFNVDIGSGNLNLAAQNFKVIGRLNLVSTSGDFDFTNVISTATANIKTNSGTIKCKKFDAHLDIETKNGYFYIDEVVGNVTLPAEVLNVDEAIFEIGSLKGNLVVFAGARSKIKVNELIGDCDITKTSGFVRIGNEESGVTGSVVIKTTSANMEVYLQDGNSRAKELISNSGNIDLYMNGQMLGNTLIKTKTGYVDLFLELGKSYLINFHKYSSNDPFDMNKVKIRDVSDISGTINNPFEYNLNPSLKGNIEIFTDRSVTLGLINNK